MNTKPKFLDGINNPKEFVTSRQFYEALFIVVVIMSFVVWLAEIFSEGSISSQFNLFFRNCEDFLADTLNVVGYSSQRDVYNNTMYTGLSEKAYPPITYVIMYFFSRLVDMNKYYELNYFLWMYQEPKFLIIYLIYAVLTMIIVYELIRTCKKGTNPVKIFTALAILVSAPMLYSFERANTIILTMFCTLFFTFFYDSEKRVMKELSLIALAFAVAFKMTPAVLGVFLIYNKQWKEILRVIIYGVVIGIVPFFFFEGGLSNLPKMLENVQLNLEAYTSDEGCTLLASVLNFVDSPTETLRFVMKLITYVVSAVFLVSGFFYNTRWEKIMAVSMVLVILPSHSGYYCILYLIPAMIAFLNEERHRFSDLWILCAMLLIMYDVQSELGDALLNYHLALLIITVVMLVRSVCVMVQKVGLDKKVYE